MWSRGRKKMPTNELVLFEFQDKSISLNVPLKNDSVWLNRNQMAELFDRDVKTIGKHINNAIREKLAGLPVVAKFATTAADGKTYMVDYYDLDVIISVGYRVKSQRGVIDSMRFGNESALFGNEKDDSFKGSVGNIYQSFAGQEAYPTLEEKAANLLYFVTKNHSFSDGNKRIAAAIFLYFLDKNEVLIDDAGNKRIDDHTLVALTIMIAESCPEEQEMMISVIMNCMDSK